MHGPEFTRGKRGNHRESTYKVVLILGGFTLLTLGILMYANPDPLFSHALLFRFWTLPCRQAILFAIPLFVLHKSCFIFFTEFSLRNKPGVLKFEVNEQQTYRDTGSLLEMSAYDPRHPTANSPVFSS